jgi:hypothetical protein
MAYTGMQEQVIAPLNVQLTDLRTKQQTIKVLIGRKEREIKELREKEKAIDEVIAGLGQENQQ